jgi:hypothetical protein
MAPAVPLSTAHCARRDPSFFYLDISTRLLDWETYQAIGGEAARIQNELDDQTRWRSVRTKKSRSFEMLREGPSAELQVLMRLAMERPKAFSKMFCAALLTQPKNWRALARSKELLCDEESHVGVEV